MNERLSDRMRRIDEYCDRFESEWRLGRRPSVSEFLRAIGAPVERALWLELLLLERELRMEAGDTTTMPGDGRPDFEPSTLLDLILDGDDAEGPWPGAEPPTVDAPGRSTEVAEAETLPRPFGAFLLLQKIGEGGMGVVYRASQDEPRREVAIKMIKVGTLATERALKLFRREIDVVGTLDHPGIVPVLDSGEQEGRRYFVMKLIPGSNLRARLGDYRGRPAEAARLVAAIADAIGHAHRRGVLHRDLKPSNVLVDAEGRPHIIDFGLAVRLTAEESLSTLVAIAGTPSYMPPELAAGDGEQTTAADIYGLGTILYGLLTESPPFPSSATAAATLRRVVEEPPRPPRVVDPQVDRDLETICLKCLQKDPARRYPTADAVAEDLRRYLDGRPIVARPASPGERLVKWVRRRPGIAGLALTLAATAAIGAAGVAWEARQVVLANADLATQRDVAREQERAARALEVEARLQAYLARMNLADRDWSDANIGHLRLMLDQTRPGPEQSDLRGFEWDYLDRLTRRGHRTITGHSGNINALAFDLRGERLASAGDDATIRLVDAATGRLLRTLADAGRPRPFRALAFDPSHDRLATASGGGGDPVGRVQLWDLTTGALVGLVGEHEGNAQCVAFRPDGRRLASGGEDGRVKVWDLDAGRLDRVLIAPERSSVTCLAYGPDGDRLATGSAAGAVDVWEAGGRRRRLAMLGTGVQALGFAPGRLAAAGGTELHVWEPASGAELLHLTAHEILTRGLAFSPDGRQLATGGHDQQVKLWDARTGALIRTFKGHSAWINAVAFRPDGARVASASGDQTVQLWHPDVEQTARTLVADGTNEHALCFGPDGSWLATAGWSDGSIRLWDAARGAIARTIPAHDDAIRGLALNPRGDLLASAGTDGRLKVWEVSRGARKWTASRRSGAVTCVAFSPDGRLLAAGGEDRDVTLYRADDGEPLGTLRGHTDHVLTIAFDPAGRRLASSGRDETIRFWNPVTGREVLSPVRAPSLVSCLAYSPDGRLLAAGGYAPTILVLDPVAGRPAFELSGHAAAVDALSFSPDGRRLVSGGTGGRLRVWDVALHLELIGLVGHKGRIGALAFRPDGRALASTDSTGVLKFWDFAR